MQVDPIKPTLKAPGTKRFKLGFDGPLSTSAFRFNLRRYIEAAVRKLSAKPRDEKHLWEPEKHLWDAEKHLWGPEKHLWEPEKRHLLEDGRHFSTMTMAGAGRYCSPRHRMPLNSNDEV